MALGYCNGKKCERLVAIEPKEFRAGGTRERNWYPFPHDKPDGTPCTDGVRKPAG